MKSTTKEMGLCTGFLEVQEVVGVTEELDIGGRMKNCQFGRISRPILQLLVDRILQSLSVAASMLSAIASMLSAAAPDCGIWFLVLCQDDFKHSFLVSRVFKMYF